MANRIKGITIEIDGNTTKLSKALKSVNKTIAETQSELRDINKLLKFNPGNAELIKQKQKALATEIDATSKKLEEEQKALAELEKNADGTEANAKQQAALKREIIETTSKLKMLEKQSRQASSVLGTQMKVAGQKVSAVGDKIMNAGKKLSRISAGFVAVGGAALKAANDYEDGLNKVNTIAGLTGDAFQKMGKDLLEVSSATGKAATEITEAAYQALSASVPTEQVADFVKTSANLAKAGFTETATAVDVLTTAINAYGLSTSEAESLANKLVQVQNDGKTTVDQLAASMGNVIPTASALGVNIDQLSAMYVLMTKQGINTANATTGIKATLNELSKSSNGAGATLQRLTGKTFGQLTKEGKNVADILKILYDSVDGDSEAFKNLFGNIRAGQGALAIMNQGVGAFNESLDRVSNSSGNVDTALETMSTPLKKAKKALNDTKNSAIVLGQSGLEALGPTITKVSNFLNQLNDRFQNLNDKQKESAVRFVAIGAAVGPATVALGGFVKGIGNTISGIGQIVSGISALLVKFGLKTAAETADTTATTANTVATAANTAAQGASATATTASGVAAQGASAGFITLNASMGLIAIAAAAIIAVGYLIYKNWDKIKAMAETLGKTISEKWEEIKTKTTETFGKIKETVNSVMGGISSYIGSKLQNIKDAYNKNGGGIKGVVAATMASIKEYYKIGFDAINAITGGKLGELVNKIGNKFGEIKNKFNSLVSSAKNWGADLIANFISGITRGFDNIKKTMQKLANIIKDLIGFSEPKTGPLSNFHTFAPDMIDLFVKGINDSLPKLQNAVTGMAATVDGGITNNKNVTVNQYNTYSSPHSQYELWKSRQDLTRTINNTVRGAI